MPSSSPYVIDNCSLYNLQDNMPLWNFPPPGDSIIITKEIAQEAKRGPFRYKDWLQSGNLENLQGQEGITFLKLLSPQQRPRIHEGEASAIAIGIHRGWAVVSDDRGAAKKAKSHNVTLLSWQEFIKEWLRHPHNGRTL